MYVINYKEREKTPVTMPGAEKTTVRWLVGRKTGATTYAMRYFEIQPGGIVPEHAHQEEHEIFVLRGEARLIGDCDGDTAKKDDVRQSHMPADTAPRFCGEDQIRRHRFHIKRITAYNSA